MKSQERLCELKQLGRVSRRQPFVCWAMKECDAVYHQQTRHKPPHRSLELGERPVASELQHVEGACWGQSIDNLQHQDALERPDLQEDRSLQQRDQEVLVRWTVTLVDEGQDSQDGAGGHVECDGA